jgi:hypothetical protein
VVYCRTISTSCSTNYISLYRIKYTYLVSQFTTIRMLLYFTPIAMSLKGSSLVMKSIVTELYSYTDTSNSCKSLYSLYYTVLALL